MRIDIETVRKTFEILILVIVSSLTCYSAFSQDTTFMVEVKGKLIDGDTLYLEQEYNLGMLHVSAQKIERSKNLFN